MEFVPHSPDLNPIEIMWAEVSKSLPSGATTPDQLSTDIQDTWWEVNNHPTLSRRLVDSLPRRFRQVLRNDGG